MLKQHLEEKKSPITMAQMAQAVLESMAPVAPMLGRATSAKGTHTCASYLQTFYCVCFGKKANEFQLT